MDKMEKSMSNPATIIGAQTHVKGNLEGDEDLTVVGRVDGNINLTKTLTVDPAGIVMADIQVQRAVISGTVVGNVTATDVVHITERGRMVGDLSAPRVVIVDGASFRGNVDMGDMDAPGRPVGARTRGEPLPRPQARPTPRPTPRATTEPTVEPEPRRRRVRGASSDALDQRAEAAARAVASATQRRSSADSSSKSSKSSKSSPSKKAKKAKTKKKAPKPPTAAGKRTRAKRK